MKTTTLIITFAIGAGLGFFLIRQALAGWAKWLEPASNHDHGWVKHADAEKKSPTH